MINCHGCNSPLIPLDLFSNCKVYIRPMGVFEAECPFCDALIAFRPLRFSIEVGYLAGAGRATFQANRIAPAEGLRITATDDGATIEFAGRTWRVPSVG